MLILERSIQSTMGPEESFTHHSFYICSLCECSPAVHTYFYDCALLDGEKICAECCTEDMIKEESIEKLSSIGVELTREKVDEICKKCKKRCIGDPNGLDA